MRIENNTSDIVSKVSKISKNKDVIEMNEKDIKKFVEEIENGEQPRKVVIIDGKLVPVSEIVKFQKRTKIKERVIKNEKKHSKK